MGNWIKTIRCEGIRGNLLYASAYDTFQLSVQIVTENISLKITLKRVFIFIMKTLVKVSRQSPFGCAFVIPRAESFTMFGAKS